MTLLADHPDTDPDTAAPTRPRGVRAGQIISLAVGAFLLFDAVTHVAGIEPVVRSFQALGFPAGDALGIGLLELACLALWAIPRTSLLGALLLTAYLGGAFCAQLRIGAPVASTLSFAGYVGIALWLGQYLRDVRLRQFAPWRRIVR